VTTFAEPDQTEDLCNGLANLDYASERLLFNASHLSGLYDLDGERFENGYNRYDNGEREIRFFRPQGSVSSELTPVDDRNQLCLRDIDRPSDAPPPIPAGTGRLSSTCPGGPACSRALQRIWENLNNTAAAINMVILTGQSTSP
jgi:hypothetical protein